MNIKSSVDVKSDDELERAVAEELKIEDPTPEQAAAALKNLTVDPSVPMAMSDKEERLKAYVRKV